MRQGGGKVGGKSGLAGTGWAIYANQARAILAWKGVDLGCQPCKREDQWITSRHNYAVGNDTYFSLGVNQRARLAEFLPFKSSKTHFLWHLFRPDLDNSSQSTQNQGRKISPRVGFAPVSRKEKPNGT
jgi:hypothetical protein